MLCVVLAAATTFAPRPAWPEVVLRKSIAYFPIAGKTADDLDRELSRRGPLTAATGARHPGATEIKFGGEIAYLERAGNCAVGPVKVVLNTKIMLPRWTSRAQATAELGLIWDTLSADIKRHEERHAEIARAYARLLEQRLKALPAQDDCAALQKLVADATKDVMAEHDRDQLRFDLVESKNFDERMSRLLKHRIERNGAVR